MATSNPTSIPDATVLIPHLDDVACALGANRAWVSLAGVGLVKSGSVMVPCSWFPDVVKHPEIGSMDLGVHLTLTSESAAARWRPVSTTDSASGLVDSDGFMWSTVPELRRHAVPHAVATELRAQIEIALAAGIDVTHLDHHMGAALAPEFVDSTVGLAGEFGLPLLFPHRIAEYLAVLNMGEVDVPVLELARSVADQAGLAVGDSFVMPLINHGRSDHRDVIESMIRRLEPGVNYLSLHCAAPGDVEAVHPNDADWRLGEYRVFSDPDFGEWLGDQPLEIIGMRGFRDELRAE